MYQTLETVIRDSELTLSPATATPVTTSVTTPPPTDAASAWARRASHANGFAEPAGLPVQHEPARA